MFRRLPGSVACLLLSLLLVSCSAPAAPPRGRRVVLVAADGASWGLLSPLMARGELPHLARLYLAGSAGVLTAGEALSPAAIWTSVATGRSRDAHGVVFDAVRAPGSHELRAVTADQRRVPALWDIASAREVTVGVAGWPATWPAEPVRGFLVAEGYTRQTAGRRGFIHPPGGLGAGGEGGEQLELPPERMTEASVDPFLEQAFADDVALLSRALSLYRVHQPRLLLLRFRSIDAVAHRFWQYHEPRYLDLAASRGEPADAALAARLAPAVAAACRALDAWLGLLQERLPADATLIVASGWGMRGVRLTDYLHVDLSRLLALLGFGENETASFLTLADTGRLPRGLYLNLPGREPDGAVPSAEGAAITRRAAEALRALRTLTGDPLFRSVVAPGRDGAEPVIELIENLSIDPQATIRVAGREMTVRELFRRYGQRYAIHDPEGLLLVTGEGIAPGRTGWTAGILDVAPTVLALLGLPSGADMPGLPIPAVVGDGAPLARIPTWNGAWPLPVPARRDEAEASEAFEMVRDAGHLE